MAASSFADEISAASSRPKTIGEWLFSELLGTVFCVGLPVCFTAMVPVSYLKLTRNGDQVSAHCKTCLLLVVPYRTQSLEEVTAIDSDVKAGEMMEVENKHDGSSDRMIRAEDEGWLILSNREKKIRVSISPANLESTRREVRDFLETSPAATAKREYKKFCVANWKASIFAGVPLTMLTVLFLVCLVSPVVALPFRLMR